jgi:hypothetical protein
MKDSKDFGFIRVWGTIGWIAINWIIALYLRFWEGLQLDVQIGGVPLVVNWAGFSPEASRVGDALMFAAALAVVMGLYCFTLPNTPPSREAKNPYAFVEAFKLTENRNFAVLLIVSFIVAIELPFYYNLTPIYLSDTVSGIGLNPSTTGFVMTFGQVAEILLMLLLAPSIRYLGMRWTIFLGILAWPVRYGIFAIGEPTWLVIAAQSLHGLCFPFFFVAGMIAVERMSRRDIRASAQGLIVFATNGVGMLIGHFLSGQVHDYFELEDGGWDWSRIFLVPILVTLIPAVAFLVLFSERRFREQSRRVEHAEADHGGTART